MKNTATALGEDTGGTTGHSTTESMPGLESIACLFLLICKCLKDMKAEREYTAKERIMGGGMHQIKARYRQVM